MLALRGGNLHHSVTKLWAVFALALFCLGAAPERPAVIGPYSSAINIAGDLTGIVGACPGTWGGCASYASRIQFNAPAGYRTRILRVYGDFISAPKTGTVPQGLRCEIGWGLKSSAADGSQRVTFPGYKASGYDNSLIWLQGYITSENTAPRLPFNADVSVGGLLEPDGILISQAFVALDQTGLVMHNEFTGTIVFDFEIQK